MVEPPSGGRRRRRWPLYLLAALLLAAGGAYGVYRAFFEKPGDVSNPDVEFTTPAEAPKPKRKRRQFEWPVYGFTPDRTRYLETKLDPPFKKVWRRRLGHLIEFQPVLANGMLYVVPNNGKATAIDARTGRVRWTTRVGTLNASSPAYDHGRLYIATLSGRITCLDAKTGRQ